MHKENNTLLFVPPERFPFQQVMISERQCRSIMKWVLVNVLRFFNLPAEMASNKYKYLLCYFFKWLYCTFYSDLLVLRSKHKHLYLLVRPAHYFLWQLSIISLFCIIETRRQQRLYFLLLSQYIFTFISVKVKISPPAFTEVILTNRMRVLLPSQPSETTCKMHETATCITYLTHQRDVLRGPRQSASRNIIRRDTKRNLNRQWTQPASI